MNDLDELYQNVILDHNRSPRNRGVIEHASCKQEGYNPLCGDKLTLYVEIVDDRVVGIKFDGEGCAISTASASMLTEAIKGKSVGAARALIEQFHGAVMGTEDAQPLGKLKVLTGVRAFPMRVKCATLAWHCAGAALRGKNETVTTE